MALVQFVLPKLAFSPFTFSVSSGAHLAASRWRIAVYAVPHAPFIPFKPRELLDGY
jgi:hypothetical protein